MSAGLEARPPRSTLPDRSALTWDASENKYSLLPLVLREPLRWREKEDEEGVELRVPSKERWRTISEYWLPVLEGLTAGENLPQVHERVAKALPERSEKEVRFIVKKVTSRLRSWELAEVLLPEVPEVFHDRYERLGELGRGGMGVVWRCRDLASSDEEEVAIKHAWNWRGSLRGREKSLREEAEMMAKADHPGIIAHIDEFELDGRFHLVRELLDGPSLWSWATERPLGVDERARLLKEIVDGLIHLRELGYLCLDVKTGNYMLDGPGRRVKLADLGLCREMKDGVVELSSFAGTLSYQDPHVRKEGLADERAVVYAVGRILYVLVRGRGFRARANWESYYQQHEIDAAKLEASHATPEEKALFAEACSPWPKDRPQTLEAFRDRIP